MAFQTIKNWLMPKAPTTYTDQQSEQFSAKLKQLASTPKGLLLRDLILKHKAEIEQALKAGYTYDDVVQVLAELKIPIKVNTLKQYLRESSSGTDEHKQVDRKPAQKPKTKSTAIPDDISKASLVTAQVNGQSNTNEVNSQGIRATNTDKNGFQAMRDDDDL